MGSKTIVRPDRPEYSIRIFMYNKRSYQIILIYYYYNLWVCKIANKDKPQS